MGRSNALEGMVIRRINVGEADRIVTLLTPEGKRPIVVRGVRKLTSKKTGSFELFHVVRLLVHETSGLPIAQEVELIQTFGGLRDNLAAAAQAFWGAELVDKLVGEEEGGQLYRQLVEYIGRVETGAGFLDVMAFELAVLDQLGWQPQLINCAHCDQRLKPGRLGWSHSLGGVVDADCAGELGCDRLVSDQTVKALRVLANGRLRVSQRLRVSAGVEAELEEILHGYLESIGERRWRSPNLLAETRSLFPAAP